MIVFYYKTILYLLIIILTLLFYILYKNTNSKETFLTTGSTERTSSTTGTNYIPRYDSGTFEEVKDIILKDPLILNAIERRLRLSETDFKKIEKVRGELLENNKKLPTLQASIQERKDEFERLKKKYERMLVENDKFKPKHLDIESINLDNNLARAMWTSEKEAPPKPVIFQKCQGEDTSKCNIYEDKNNEILKSVSQKFIGVDKNPRYLSIYKAKLPDEWIEQNKGHAYRDNLYYIYSNINGSRKCLKFHSIDIFEFGELRKITYKKKLEGKKISNNCDLLNTDQLFIKIEIGCYKDKFEECTDKNLKGAIDLYNHYIKSENNNETITTNSEEYFKTMHLFKIFKFNKKKLYILVPFNYPKYAVTLKTNDEISIKPMTRTNRRLQQFIQIEPPIKEDNIDDNKDKDEITIIMNNDKLCPKK